LGQKRKTSTRHTPRWSFCASCTGVCTSNTDKPYQTFGLTSLLVLQDSVLTFFQSVESALRDCARIPVKEFALVAILENGQPKVYRSSNLTPTTARYFSNQLKQDFRDTIRPSAEGSYPSSGSLSITYASTVLTNCQQPIAKMACMAKSTSTLDTTQENTRAVEALRRRGVVVRIHDKRDPMTQMTMNQQVRKENDLGALCTL